MFNTSSLGLTVDAFTGGALIVDGVIERTLTIEQHTHQSAFLPIRTLTQHRLLANWAYLQIWPTCSGKSRDQESVGDGSHRYTETGGGDVLLGDEILR